MYSLTKKGTEISVFDKKTQGVFQTSIRTIVENLEDGIYDMDIKKHRNKRTSQQNRLYWAYIHFIAIEIGYVYEGMEKVSIKEICEALHEDIKDKYIRVKTIKSTKDKRRKLKLKPSTTNLDTKEFGEKIINRMLLDFPFLPLPNDSNIDNFIQFYGI